MRILSRILGLTAVGLFAVLICLQLINVDVRRDEMETISTLAMTQTQTIMEEQIADEIYGFNNNRKTIASNDEYFQEYVKNFQKLITSDCQYQLELMDADYEKGLLDVNVVCRYRNLAGQEKTMSLRKTNIVEAVDNTEEGIVVPFYDITYELQRGRVVGKNPTRYNEFTDPDIKLINPIRTGYNFVGWTGSNGQTPQKTVTIDVSKKEHLHYIANWDMITYNILYDMNGGTNPASNPKHYTIETDTFTLKNPTKEHYDFKGWTGSNGRTPSTKVTVTRGHYGNRTYTANWDLHKYGITYNLNGGVNHAENPKNYTVQTPDIVLKTPTRYGYNFHGWYEDAGFTRKITTIDTARAENITLYAKWTPKVATITFDSNNGTGATFTKSFTVDDNPANLRLEFPNWTRKGYHPINYLDSKGQSFELTQHVSNQWIIEHEGNQTLRVNWNAKQVQVTFVHDAGGSNITRTYTYDGGNQYFPGANEWSRNNYTAIHYSYQSGGSSAFGMGSNVPNDWIDSNEGKVTLYVVWKANIIYGYQNATSWSSNFTTSIPADGFYRTAENRAYASHDGGPQNYNEGTWSSSFTPTRFSSGGYCHTGECHNMQFQGYNDSTGWQTLCSGYQSKGGGMSCSPNTSTQYRGWRTNCTSRGSNGYDKWNGSACVGYAGEWYGYQLSSHKVEGYVLQKGYNAVTGWGSTITMPNYNSYTKTNSRRLVYSRDGGASWNVCSNYGSSCPTS